jgi:hypothetical protein
MSDKLWIAYETPAKTFLDLASFDGCTYVSEFLNSLYKRPLLPIPANIPITLYKSDGITEIRVGDSPAQYLLGNNAVNPLIVKATADAISLSASLEQKNNLWNVWILTIGFKDWSVPDSIETLSNVKYIRGQLEFSKSQLLHWHVAVQYFEPTSFAVVREQFTKKALIERILSFGSWDYVWKEKASCEGTRFELGDNSDILNAVSQNQTGSVQNTFGRWDINNFQERLKSAATNLIFFKNESLERLWDALEKAEMIDLKADFEDSDENMDQSTQVFHGLTTPPSFKRPKNHGKIWKDQHIEELERLLKQEFITLDEIAGKLGRSKKSIESRAAELVIRLIDDGTIPEEAIQRYKGKVSMEMLNEYQRYRERKRPPRYTSRRWFRM